MDSMPNEILELIFAHIPMTDLFKVHSLVCKNWKDVISRELYMPWKKSYYRYKVVSVQNLSKIKSGKPTTPPAKKSKIEYKDDSDDTDDNDDVNNDVSSLDMKLKSLYGQMGAFSNYCINIKNHLHPPVTDSKVADKFRLETAAPWLINFVRNEFEREDKLGQFRSVYHS